MRDVVLIGYSGHGYVACDILMSMGHTVIGYCDMTPKENNPFKLKYLGDEKNESISEILKRYLCFIAIGDNLIRRKVSEYLLQKDVKFINAIHPSSVVSTTSIIGKGVMIAPNVVINTNSIIEDGVICNTGCIIEHDCIVKKYSHIAPGAVLCGGVQLEEDVLVGANAVLRKNVSIGNKVKIGEGSVVTKNILNYNKAVGNPHRIIK